MEQGVLKSVRNVFQKCSHLVCISCFPRFHAGLRAIGEVFQREHFFSVLGTLFKKVFQNVFHRSDMGVIRLVLRIKSYICLEIRSIGVDSFDMDTFLCKSLLVYHIKKWNKKS